MSDEAWANNSLRQAIQAMQDVATKPLHMEIESQRERIERLEGALIRIHRLDHNEREWESVDEIKAFARAALEEKL